MDEGLTDYQTDWAQKLTPQEQIGRPPVPPRLPRGVSRQRGDDSARTTAPGCRAVAERACWAARSRSERRRATSREFGIYNEMIYDRAKLMYSQLRDVLGDSAFRAFLHDYYDRWALKHVDERAMRSVGGARRPGATSAGSSTSGCTHTGLMDYAIGSVRRDAPTARGSRRRRTSSRRGELRHPMPVGVHTRVGLDDRPHGAQADDARRCAS